jgi:signal transduction histidine kinase
MRLACFIRSRMDEVVGEWESFARTRLPAAGNLSAQELRDEAATLLGRIADDLESAQTEPERQDKSRGLRPGNAPRLTEVARGHARDRLAQGFTLDQMVSEYRALRASVTRHFTTASEVVRDAAALEELVRFNEAMDQALGESIGWYWHAVEESRALLLGVLGHDLRNPLGAIKASARVLVLEHAGPQALQDSARRILSSSERMQRMVNDLLDFTRTRLAQPLPLTRGPVDLRPVAESTVEELRTMHPERTIVLRCAGDLAGHWDAERLAQLVSNLVANAIQHSAASTPVTVSVEADVAAVRLQVHNTGAPIDRRLLPTLFEPLVRTPNGRDHHANLGLGLYIANVIVRAHGGDIGVDSSAERGTTFTVTLPRATD